MTSGSQKRKTTAQIKVNCTPEQKAAIMGRASSAGLSPAAICLAMLLDAPLPKARRRRQRTAEQETLNKILTEFQRHRGDLGKALSNLNQLTHYANMSRTLEASIFETIHELERWIDTVEGEFRDALLEALGEERPRKPPKDE